MSRKAEVAAMVGQIIADASHVDTVVNNGGILISHSVEALEEEQWDAVLDVNAKGTFLGHPGAAAAHACPPLRAHRQHRVHRRQAWGAAARALLGIEGSRDGLYRVLAQEVGPDGITANCVCPGIIVTEMGRTSLPDQANVDKWVA